MSFQGGKRYPARTLGKTGRRGETLVHASAEEVDVPTSPRFHLLHTHRDGAPSVGMVQHGNLSRAFAGGTI